MSLWTKNTIWSAGAEGEGTGRDMLRAGSSPGFTGHGRRRNGIDPGREPVNAAEDIFAAIRQEKDPENHPFVTELGRINARGVSDIIVAYDPDTIVFDGSVALKNPDLIVWARHPVHGPVPAGAKDRDQPACRESPASWRGDHCPGIRDPVRVGGVLIGIKALSPKTKTDCRLF